MSGRNIGVRKYAVRLSEDERRRLEEIVRKGRSPAKRLLKADIIEGRRFRTQRRLERRGNHCGVGYELRNGLLAS
jgi:hypothetical protein